MDPSVEHFLCLWIIWLKVHCVVLGKKFKSEAKKKKKTVLLCLYMADPAPVLSLTSALRIFYKYK